MNQSHPLDLPFRGKRHYLHGTDIYTSIVSLLRDEASEQPVSLSFHSQIFKQPDLVATQESDLASQRESPRYRGDVRIGSGSESRHWTLMESDREVTRRLPCVEAEVVTAFHVDTAQRLATLPPNGAGNAIEQVVFLNKHLHLHLLPVPTTQWLFARIELQHTLPDPSSGEVSVKLDQVLGGRFTRSSITWDGERLGTLFFSLAA